MYLAELDLHEVVEAEKQQQGIDFIDYDEGICTGDGYIFYFNFKFFIYRM